VNLGARPVGNRRGDGDYKPFYFRAILRWWTLQAAGVGFAGLQQPR
jgi:hypothetical protein